MLVTSTGSLHFAWTFFFAYGTPTSVPAMPHDPPGTGSIPENCVCLYQIWATSGDRQRRTKTPHNVATEYQFTMSPTVAEVLLMPDERTPKLYVNRRCQKLFMIYLSSIVNQPDAPVSPMYLFWVTLYMFRTVFPSIIRSLRLYIQQQAYVKQILLPAASGNASSR
jgi:hypothetical protein